MAVDANVVSSRMQLKLKTGVNESGKDIIRTKTYSNVKVSTENQSIYGVANQLAGLQNYPLEEIHRVDDVLLINL